MNKHTNVWRCKQCIGMVLLFGSPWFIVLPTHFTDKETKAY